MRKILSCLAASLFACACVNYNMNYDVAVVGGGSSGISAGVSAARNGARTLIVEEGPWLGGMLTSAGVCGVDGNYHLRGGFFREFCDSVAAHYGGYDNLHSAWVANVIFEPKVGAAIFRNIAEKQEGLDVRFNTSFVSAERRNGRWRLILRDDRGAKLRVNAGILIDGTELGDVAAAVGVPYRIGMDSRSYIGESIAPEEENNIIQDLTYAVVLKDFGSDADMTIPRPATYDSTAFRNAAEWRLNAPELTNRVIWPADYMIRYARIPTYNQYMINWPIDGNDYYLNLIEESPEIRAKELEKAKEFTRCFIYFIQTELGMKNLGIDMDQFPTDDGFPLIPYHRESRRIEGEVFFTMDYAGKPFEQAHPLYRTGIAVGDYAVDHHHARYPHYDDLPDLHFYPIPSYNVPMGSLIPKAVDGMLVIEKSISVSNIMNGASRVQPVTMQIGQAAGIIAAIAANEGIEPRRVPVRRVQQALLDAGGYIMPYIDTKPDDTHFAQYQRIGATGILKGDPRNVGWANQTWFRADEPLTPAELEEGLLDWYGDVADAALAIAKLGIKVVGGSTGLTRGEFAILVDEVLNPFGEDVDLCGRRIHKRPLTHDDYDAWNDFGKVEVVGCDTLVYEVKPQVGESETLYICLSTGEKGKYRAFAPDEVEAPAVQTGGGKIVKVWAWDDDYLMPELEKKAGLGEPELPKTPCRYVFWGTDKKYRIQRQWELEQTADYYVTDTETGEERLVMEGAVIKYDGFSPDGRYVCYLDCPTGLWHLYDIPSGEDKVLTKGAKGIFTDDENDTPCWPFGFNWAKWGSDSRHVYIQEKYDVWAYDVIDQDLKKLTDGAPEGVTYRWDTGLIEGDFIDPDKDLYLSVFDHATKERGLAVLHPEGGVETIFMGPYSVEKILRAESGFVVQKGRFETGRDLYYIADDGTEKQLTRINPQIDNLNWGTVELVDWKVRRGARAEGLLFKPEDFDGSRQYPMLVYFYERNSDNLYAVRDPMPAFAKINIPYFVSNGYLVFVPDIRYEVGHPGKSAVDYVVSGVDALCRKYPWVDSKHIGIQGQSWGGYQTAFIVTQTGRFAAACAGAPVANMTSAYGGMRGSGKVRQWLYEQAQSRIGKNLWDGFDLYVENSPLFHAPKITTPLLIMHADADEAVPWSQGVEFFTALKRLGKPAWLLQYVGEPHDLGSREAAMDLSRRFTDFFDHYLKGAPLPDWMAERQ